MSRHRKSAGLRALHRGDRDANRSNALTLACAPAKTFRAERLEKRLLLSSNTVRFANEITFPVGSDPSSAIAADVNGDGKADLVVTNYYGSTVSVLLGNGNGTFTPEQEFPTNKYPAAVAALDINGDGKVDLAVADSGYNTVSILLGNGNGTFQNQQVLSVGSDPRGVALCDLNNDNKPDLIVANELSGSVSVFLGNGNGTFGAQHTFSAGLDPGPIAAIDVSGDGKPDLVIANINNPNVTVLLGNGDGTFQAPRSLAIGNNPYSMAVADFNGDHNPDIAVVNDLSTNTVSVLLGNGNGTFQPPQTYATSATFPHLVAADFNADGKMDLAVSDFNHKAIGVLVGNGDGTFLPQQTIAVKDFPGFLVAADFDGEGTADLATLHSDSNDVGVLLNRSFPPMVLSINRTSPAGPTTSASSVNFTVTFNKPVTGVDSTDFAVPVSGVTYSGLTVTPVSGSVYTVTVGGISGTGTLGLNLVDNGSIRDLGGYPLAGGPASFAPQQTFAVNGNYPDYVVAADVNGDGKLDLIVANRGAASQNYLNGSISVLLGNGDGTFQAPRTYAAGQKTEGIAVADFTGDGRPDILVANYGLGYGLGGSPNVSILVGNGNGTFQAAQALLRPTSPSFVAAADLNGDGKPDFLDTSIYANGHNPSHWKEIGVLLGNGNGTFHGHTAALGDTSPVIVTDINGDGKPDAIYASSKSYNASYDIVVAFGDGTGFFSGRRTFNATPTSTPPALAVGDLNGDIKSDLVAVVPGQLGIWLGNGDGTLQNQQTYAISGDFGAPTLADVNDDGNLDLVGSVAGGIGVLLGNGNGTFQAERTFAMAGSNPTIADLNGDGLPDILTTSNTLSGAVSVLLAQDIGSFIGQTYTILPLVDTINGTSGVDTITLIQDVDHVDIDWALNTPIGPPTFGQFSINDPRGLTINGNGNSDSIILDYSGGGGPLPKSLHLNGTFTISTIPAGVLGTNPLAGRTLDIGRSTVFFNYSNSDPIAAFKSYLQNGYNGGAWSGTPTASTGVITSAAAQANPNRNTAIGYADSADGQGIDSVPNTIELTYTLYGDANLDHQVNSADLQRFLNFFNTSGPWDNGDFNYDGLNNSADQQIILFNFNTQLGSQATPLAIAATPAATTPATNTSSDPSRQLVPAIQATGSSDPVVHHLHPAKAVVKKRR